jgi:hypothetical protein
MPFSSVYIAAETDQSATVKKAIISAAVNDYIFIGRARAALHYAKRYTAFLELYLRNRVCSRSTYQVS